MTELLEGRLAPITYTIGFLECDCARAVEKYLQWQGPIQQKRGVSLVAGAVNGRLEQVVERLLPLHSVERRRFLFMPTAGPWTAYLDNGHKGTDAVAPMSYMAEALQCRALRVTAIPDECLKDRYPARILEMYGAQRTHFLNYIRSISLAYDGRSWTFTATGAVQPFENAELYQKVPLQSRFSMDTLDAYLRALQIRAFAEDFYLPPGSGAATLIEKVGTIAPAAKEFSLAELRGS